MTELERALVALGSEVDFPAAPDLRPRVREQLERKRFARPLVLAVALLVIAFGIAMAVPPARSAILRFFHIGSVTIERVQKLPHPREAPLAAALGPARGRPARRQDVGARPRYHPVRGQPTSRRVRIKGHDNCG